MQLTTVERQTYSLLDWIGDCGGLYDGLKLLVGKIIAPIAAIALKAELLTFNFRERVTENTSKVHQQAKRIILPGCMCCRSKKNRFRKMLERAETTVSK